MQNRGNKTPFSPKQTGIIISIAALLAILTIASVFLLQGRAASSGVASYTLQSHAVASPVATATRGAIKVEVTLTEFKITSSITTFKVGTPYYFVVTNIGHSLHEFLIMPDKPNGSNYLVNGQYTGPAVDGPQIEPGTTLAVNYIFPPSSTTHYEIACLMRGHYAAGMSRPIVVTKS